ncbi:MAG: phospholipid scramblase-related protein [Oligoflexales bacterium]
MRLTEHNKVLVHQIFEAAELIGFETRNKYEILDENLKRIAYAAEQQKGFFGFFMRQFLGHWRTFTVHFFNMQRRTTIIAHHPFRIFFQRLEVRDGNGNFIGALQQRFSIFSKKFDVHNGKNQVIMKMSSPIWKFWTFPFYNHGNELARVEKKWSGILSEAFTDKDKFLVTFGSKRLGEDLRQLILAASVFIDLQYFEKKAGKGGNPLMNIMD